ncbi:cytochrome P450 [Schizophyllum commune]
MFPTLLLALSVGGCLYGLVCALHNLYFSPLRHIPGPWYAAVSDFWLWTCFLRLRQCQIIHGLFEVYGPVVRIGPRRVAFNDVAGVKSVYCVHRLDKSDLYKMALECGQDHAFCIRERGPHAARRKTFAQHYTQHHILNFLPQMQERVAALISILKTKDEPVDCLSMFHCLMTDVLLTTTFGAHRDAFQKWASGEEDVSVAMEDFPKRGMLRTSLPAWLWRLLTSLPIPRWRRFCAADEIVYKFVSDIVDDDIVKRLRDELDGVADSGMGSRDILALQKLPYLNAVLKEGESPLRLYTAVPSLLERVVPHLQKGDEPFDLLGYSIPGGTVVGVQLSTFEQWSLSRDPTVFPSPYKVIPERWLDGDVSSLRANDNNCLQADNTSRLHTANDISRSQPTDLTTLQSHSFPFGFGSRICVGRHLALMMMQLVVAGLVREFDIEAPPGTDERSMEVRDMFAIFPAGLACKLVFRPRSSTGQAC